MKDEDLITALREINKCLAYNLYQPAIAAIAVTMENLLIESLLSKSAKIKKEERTSKKKYYLPELNEKALSKNLISQKTYERIEILNRLRRFGTHSKTGATLGQDASYALKVLEQTITELAGNTNASKNIKELNAKIAILEQERNQLREDMDTFMCYVHQTVKGKSISIPLPIFWVVNVASQEVLLILAMLAKYGIPTTHKDLKERLNRFKIITPKSYQRAIRQLMFSSIIFVSHPANRKRKDSEYAEITMNKRIHKELSKYLRLHWRELFKNYKEIEPDFDSETK